MTETRLIPLRSIRVDEAGIYGRTGTSHEIIKAYADDYEGGARMPPVVVFHHGGEYWLADGFHRVAALRLDNEDAEVLAEVHEGIARDALLHACGANAEHGLRRSRADKERVVGKLLADEEWKQWSDRDIARHCCVSHTYVARMRAADVTGNVASERTFTTKHGSAATMDTRKIGKRPAQASEDVEVLALADGHPPVAPEVQRRTADTSISVATPMVVEVPMSVIRRAVDAHVDGVLRFKIEHAAGRAFASAVCWMSDEIDEADGTESGSSS